jgi:MoaA/NifB/PqqE/SkfB family radical SAM enzyme
MATNGQSLTSKTTKLLLGKNIRLYVSLDAACKETYAKIRNDRWDSIIPNIIKLGQERKKKHNLPIIFMVFMPMRVNRNDLEDYFRLCQKIEADSLILRPLNFLSNTNIEIERAGYTYNYQNELLTPDELKEVFLECEEFSQTYGVRVGSQFEFGLNDKNKQQSPNTGKWN